MSFFAWTFLNFLAHCVYVLNICIQGERLDVLVDFYSIFILGRIYKWLFRAKIAAWFRMCGNTMGIERSVGPAVKSNQRAMSIASTREIRNLYPGTCVPKQAKIFYILPKEILS